MIQEINTAEETLGIKWINKVISVLNDGLKKIDEHISTSSKEEIFTQNVPNFEKYTLTVLFSDNNKKADIEVYDDKIEIKMGDTTVMVTSDGIIQ